MWEERISSKYNAPYWFNATTGQSVWTRPGPNPDPSPTLTAHTAPPPPTSAPKQTKSIALLFLTTDNITHVDAFDAAGYMHECAVFIHPKPDRVSNIHKPLKRYVVDDPIPTTWGGMTIVDATIKLLRAAHLRGHEWFALLSYDTYPLLPATDFARYIHAQTKSIFQLEPPAPAPAPVPTGPGDANQLWKASQWWIINRTDAAHILNAYDGGTSPAFTLPRRPTMAAFDEVYFLTLLHRVIPAYTFTNARPMFTEWVSSPTIISKHPVIFNRLLKEDRRHIHDAGSIFIRKTTPTFINGVYQPKSRHLILSFVGSHTNTQSLYAALDRLSNTMDIIFILMDDSIRVPDEMLALCIKLYSVHWKSAQQVVPELIAQYTPIWSHISVISETFHMANYIPHSDPVKTFKGGEKQKQKHKSSRRKRQSRRKKRQQPRRRQRRQTRRRTKTPKI